MTAPEIADVPRTRDHRSALALAVRAGRGVLVSRSGEIADADSKSLASALAHEGLILVHAPFLSRRLNLPLRGPVFDLGELFAFVHPARFATPTVHGLSSYLGLGSAASIEEEALLVHTVADRLLADLTKLEGADRENAVSAAQHMARAPWLWAPAVLDALHATAPAKPSRYIPWHDLTEWEEPRPRPEPSAEPLPPGSARAALDTLLARALDPAARETRADQARYTEAASRIFDPRQREDEPTMVLAEAGTGIGKTIGYLAPAALWARRNQGAVWVSTYTKNLQRQISQTLARIQLKDDEVRLRTVIRKGRENYLCLLNYEEMSAAPFLAVAAGLIGRWLAHTADGDLIGGDFPAWLVPLLGGQGARDAQGLGLTDRRGECIYGACAHYRKCFIEQMRVKSEDAELVVANHAVLLTRAAGDAPLPRHMARTPLSRLVLDEGHHLADAADDAFSAHLTARDLGELRRFLRGPEDRRARGRGRTLMERAGDLLPDDPEAHAALQKLLRLANALPTEQWRKQLAEGFDGPGYRFLSAVEDQVLARSTRAGDDFGLECEVRPASDRVAESAKSFAEVLAALAGTLRDTAARLIRRLTDEADTLDTGTRARIDSLVRSLVVRADGVLANWQAMLEGISASAPPGSVEWFSYVRGSDAATGMHRHAIDPTIALARHLYQPAHGVLVTSATLFDGSEAPKDRSGAGHLTKPAAIARFASPFPYIENARVFVVRDVDTRDIDQLAVAMRVLFQASGGGALGLFTAISRLRAVHRKLRGPLEGLGLPLYAQHVDEIDAGTLVDIFRSEIDSCLLGTDAVREGIDVAGRSLRLLVLERVPWPRPDLLHKARAEHFGGREYEEEIVRRRITQAFGRLIRRGDDKGAFVVLGAQVPSRLLSGLPAGVEIVRTGLAEASRQIAEFLI